MTDRKKIEYVEFPLNEGVSDMFDVNPRTLRRVDVDGICLRDVSQKEMSTWMVRCAPSVFTDARHSLITVVFFDAWFEIMPMVELDLPGLIPRRHLLVSPGWIRDLVTNMQFECPVAARSMRAETAVIDLVSSRDGRIALRNDWSAGCN